MLERNTFKNKIKSKHTTKEKPNNKPKNKNKILKTYFSKVQRLLIEHSAMASQCIAKTYKTKARGNPTPQKMVKHHEQHHEFESIEKSNNDIQYM
jgi:hypothetical protein